MKPLTSFKIFQKFFFIFILFSFLFSAIISFIINYFIYHLGENSLSIQKKLQNITSLFSKHEESENANLAEISEKIQLKINAITNEYQWYRTSTEELIHQLHIEDLIRTIQKILQDRFTSRFQVEALILDGTTCFMETEESLERSYSRIIQNSKGQALAKITMACPSISEDREERSRMVKQVELLCNLAENVAESIIYINQRIEHERKSLFNNQSKALKNILHTPLTENKSKFEIISFIEQGTHPGGCWWGCFETPYSVRLFWANASFHHYLQSYLMMSIRTALESMHLQENPIDFYDVFKNLDNLMKSLTQGKNLISFGGCEIFHENKEAKYINAGHFPLLALYQNEKVEPYFALGNRLGWATASDFPHLYQEIPFSLQDHDLLFISENLTQYFPQDQDPIAYLNSIITLSHPSENFPKSIFKNIQKQYWATQDFQLEVSGFLEDSFVVMIKRRAKKNTETL